MRLAVGQAPATSDVDEAVRAAVVLVDAAAAAGARLLLLSELFLTGYDPATWSIEQSLDPGSPRLRPLRDAARSTGVSVLVGAATRGTDGTLRNSLLLVDVDGSVGVAYDKRQLWVDERSSFVAGDDAVVLDVDGVLVGLGVCYDAGFPEAARAYGRAGVHALLFASAFASGEEQHRYELYHPARALENGCFTAVSNAVGRLGDVDFSGNGLVVDPRGHVVARLGDADEIIVVDVDVDDVVAARADLPYLTDLRPVESCRTVRTLTS